MLRYTNTEKWADSWFSQLKQIEMLLFIYLCDNCNNAGFIDINYKRWASDLGSSIETIEGALKGLRRGYYLSKENDCIYLRNFLKHQKNYPLNEKNPAHRQILSIFYNFLYKFDIQDINKFIEGASMGLQCPLGNGIVRYSNGNSIVINDEKKSEKKEIKIKYAENVFMTEIENSKLILKYGSENVKLMFEKLNNYKKSTGKNYKCDYSAILNWVADEILNKNNSKNLVLIQKERGLSSDNQSDFNQ